MWLDHNSTNGSTAPHSSAFIIFFQLLSNRPDKVFAKLSSPAEEERARCDWRISRPMRRLARLARVDQLFSVLQIHRARHHGTPSVIIILPCIVSYSMHGPELHRHCRSDYEKPLGLNKRERKESYH